jgi:hemerythrin-like domain-containing protein
MTLTATQNLENDHVHVLRLTDIMLKMVEKKAENVVHMELIVNLVRFFADGLHHAKEEDLLFPMLVKKGFSPEHGPVAVMLAEHVLGRTYIRGVADGITAFKAGDRSALDAIYENLEEYAFLLNAHINKENNILFRMADQALSANDQSMLLAQFDDVEKHTEPAYQTANAVKSIDELASVYLKS